MWRPWIIRAWSPEYTWPRPQKAQIALTTPSHSNTEGLLVRRFWGYFHRLLARFSKYYCSWNGVTFNPHIIKLPFGLVLKWHERVSIGEAIAMRMARAAGMPVPYVLSCGEHPRDWRKVSILMTRLPGMELDILRQAELELGGSEEVLDLEAEGPWAKELSDCLNAMRTWQNPFGKGRICSAGGGVIFTGRVPRHQMGPFNDEGEMHDYLLGVASPHGFSSTEEYQQTLVDANKVREMEHRVVFTHGDFKAHNILIDEDEHLSGILDWECAGWHPEYWEYTTAMRFGIDGWWYQVAALLGGERYMAELECDIALNKLTVDSYVAW